jgi:hypothetical protein
LLKKVPLRAKVPDLCRSFYGRNRNDLSDELVDNKTLHIFALDHEIYVDVMFAGKRNKQRTQLAERQPWGLPSSGHVPSPYYWPR